MESLVKEEYPSLDQNGITYLDHAGASLYAKSQIDSAHAELTSQLLCNPHTNFGHLKGLPDVNARICQARQDVLRFFGTNEDNHSVIFVSGATQALKLALEISQKTQFLAYLDECHTSAVGLRDLAEHYQVWTSENVEENLRKSPKHGIFTFPAMSNFNGEKFPVEKWSRLAQKCGLQVILDAASFVSSNPLDLSIIEAPFVCISFYKIFGYPTGLGALIVKNSSIGSNVGKIDYFGGGTVEMHLVNSSKHVRKVAEAGFEHGTVHYQGILALKHGFDAISKFGGMRKISNHSFGLAKNLYDELKEMTYDNGIKVVQLYNSNDFKNQELQGAIVNFNIRQKDGSLFGFTEFRKIAIHNNLVVRVGCFCNIGSCQKYLGLTDHDILENHKAGHVCGDNIDIINGKPTGSIRVSFGHYSLKKDADLVISIIKDHFMGEEPAVIPNLLKDNVAGKPTISALYLYPIKSCGAFKVTQGSWPLSETSLKYDRQFAIMQGRSTLTQKREPLLCQIKPEIDLKNEVMTLTAPFSEDSCQVSLRNSEFEGQVQEGQFCSGKVCGDQIEGWDCGDHVADWLERVLGLTGLRLIKLGERKPRKDAINLQSFANEAQFLVLSRSSAQDLHSQSQLEDPSCQGVDWMLEQFRGNLVIDGCNPYEEDQWTLINAQDISLHVIGPCTRCNIISVNQANSEKVQEPLESLAKNQSRRFKFGVLAGCKSSMEGKYLTVGCQVEFA